MINSRLASLRKKMFALGIDALIIPSNDPHLSEYPPKHWMLREWITGFTGSAGLAVITQNSSGLWTDSRYFLQAEEQLKNTEIKLHKVTDRSSPGYVEWICNNLNPGQNVGVLSELCSYEDFTQKQKLFKNSELNLICVDDIFHEVWSDRPSLPQEGIFEHKLEFAGIARTEKLALIRQCMKENNCQSHIVTTLDDIAWILNLRGSDVECNPVFVSYLLIQEERTYLFVHTSKVDSQLKSDLEKEHIFIEEYENWIPHLQSLEKHSKVLLDKSLININTYNALSNVNIIAKALPSIELKSIKSKHEIEQFKKCMVRDGVALAHAFYWLENSLNTKEVSEYEFAQIIASERAKQEYYHSESFNAIVGYQSNGAIIHYRPEKGKCKSIKNSGMLLVDCGGQYYNGTTDITRTIGFANISEEQKSKYTYVLKGHIALAASRFPQNTPSTSLDALARQFLWQQNLDYSHGTGHGVGFFNSVHEGPQSLAPGCNSRGSTIIKEGMVTSNEPGFYKDGEYGIRIENLILSKRSSEEGFLEFETISLFPIDTRLIDRNLITQFEINWINNYHHEVFEKLSPHLSEQIKNWLKDKCQQI